MGKKRKKKKTTVRDLAKKELREAKKEQGYFDGRFAERADVDKAKYNRKNKHKGKDFDQDDE